MNNIWSLLDDTVRVYRRTLENGDIAYAVFNMTRKEVNLGKNSAVRNVWSKENLPCTENITCEIEPHGVCILRVTPT